MPRQPESRLVRKLQELIQARPSGRCFKIQGGAESFQEVGIPDLLCCIAGRFVGIEAKLPGEKPSAMQVKALREIFEAGGVAAIVETAGQGARLLSYLEREATSEAYDPRRGVCFDRGVIHDKFWLG